MVIKESIEKCDNSESAPIVIFISKMQPISNMSYVKACTKTFSGAI